MPPLVTVVLTVYQRTEYLREAIDSVLRQTLQSFEIIVTDDSDSAAIKEICDSYATPLVRYRTNPVRLGVVQNLKAAFGEAKGRYIGILNDDDAWEPTFLEKLTQPLEEKPSRALAFSDHWIMDGNSVVDKAETDKNTAHYGRDIQPPGEVTNIEDFVLVRFGVPVAMASVFRKDALDMDLLSNEVIGTYDYWISVVLAGQKKILYYVPERLTRYRLHGTMETARRAPDKNKNWIFIYQRLIELGYFPGKADYLRERCSYAMFQVGKDNLFFDQVEQARQHFSQSLQVKKTFRAFVGLLISYLPGTVRRAAKFTAA